MDLNTFLSLKTMSTCRIKKILHNNIIIISTICSSIYVFMVASMESSTNALPGISFLTPFPSSSLNISINSGCLFRSAFTHMQGKHIQNTMQGWQACRGRETVYNIDKQSTDIVFLLLTENLCLQLYVSSKHWSKWSSFCRWYLNAFCWMKIIIFKFKFHLTLWGRGKMAAVTQTTLSKRIFLNENVWISNKISLNFVQIPRVRLTIFHHWFR